MFSGALLLSSSYLVAKTLGSNDGNLIADSLVGLEVEGQLGVVPLNDNFGGLLNGLSTNATHVCGCRERFVGEVVVSESQKILCARLWLGSLSVTLVHGPYN